MVADLRAAFDDDPVLSWVFPDPSARRRYGAAYFDVHASRSMRAGTCWHTDGGAALWDPPRAWRLGVGESAALALRSLPGLGLLRGRRVGAALLEVERVHPPEPHWYLAVLGVRPERAGRGLGGALLAAGLERVDTERMPAYLESSSPRNVPLDQRHGFEVTGEHPLRDGPVLTLMWRPAR